MSYRYKTSSWHLFCLLCFVILFVPGYLYSQTIPDSTNNDSLWYTRNEKDFNLILAADSGNTRAVLWLLNHGASINAATNEGVTPLMYAAQNGYLDVVNILVLNGADVNRKNMDSVSALIGAVQMQQEEIADFLLQQGADPDVTDKDRVTSLMYASANNYPVLADMLLYYGANTEIQDYNGNDAFMVACYSNNMDIAGLLVYNGVNIDTTDFYGNTPLMIAAQKGYATLCDSLLIWGANPMLKNQQGYTALAMAVASGQVSTVEILVKQDQMVNENIRKAVTPLDLAVKNDSIYLVLKAHGAHRSIWPDFSIYQVGPEFSFNGTDYMNGLTFGMQDSKYHFSVRSGLDFRVKAKSVLVHTDVNADTSNYFQYWERRYTMYAALEKSFILFKLKNSNTVALNTAFAGCFSFGGYRGSKAGAQNIWMLSPSLSLQLRQKSFIWSGGYRYANYGLNYVSPHRIEISLIGLIRSVKSNYSRKNIYWLNQQYP